MLRAEPITIGELASPVRTTTGAAIIATREWRASAAPRTARPSDSAERRYQAKSASPPSVPSQDATPTRWSQSMVAKIGPPPANAWPAKLIPANAPALAASTPSRRIVSTSRAVRPRRRASSRTRRRPAARRNATPVPTSATRMAMANGVHPKGAAKSNGRPWWPGRLCAVEPMAPAENVRKSARARNVPSAVMVIAPQSLVAENR